MCDDAGCDHRDYLPRRRADEDRRASFGMPYKGPALPQHVVDMDGPHLGKPMVAVKGEAGE